MKKKMILWILILALAVLIFCGTCWHKNPNNIQIDQITNLAQILAQASEIRQQYETKQITLEEMNKLTSELEVKYEELTQNNIDKSTEEIEKMQNDIQKSFDDIQNTIQQSQIGLSDRAKGLGLTEPVGLTPIASQSNKTTYADHGFDSITLVYSGDYVQSMEQAKIIADKADVSVSPEFKALHDALSGQADAQLSEVLNSIKGIVYSNHGLLDTDINYLITISVDENGKLTISAINYKQMKNK